MYLLCSPPGWSTVSATAAGLVRGVRPDFALGCSRMSGSVCSLLRAGLFLNRGATLSCATPSPFFPLPCPLHHRHPPSHPPPFSPYSGASTRPFFTGVGAFFPPLQPLPLPRPCALSLHLCRRALKCRGCLCAKWRLVLVYPSLAHAVGPHSLASRAGLL